jgi:lambda family phage portal protein
LVRLGVRYDRKGRIVSYFIRKTHPGDTKQVNLEYDEVPADRVLHVFEPWFAGQSRGLPWMVRAIQRTKDAKDYDDSTILKAQVEACFAAFVESPYSAFDAAEGASTGTTAGGKPMQDMIPGTIQYLNPGEKISFGSPAAPGGGFMGFMEWCYGRIAAAVSWPYEMVTRRWSGLSFAAGRLVLSEAKMVTGIGQRLMREAWFSRVWNRMVEEAVIVGEVDVSAAEFLRSPWIYTEHDWIPPKWDYAINPGEEVRADVDEIESGLATYEEKLGKRGHDLETFIAMRARERRLLADAGLPVSPEQVSRYQRPQTQQAPADQQQTEEVLA